MVARQRGVGRCVCVWQSLLCLQPRLGKVPLHCLPALGNGELGNDREKEQNHWGQPHHPNQWIDREGGDGARGQAGASRRLSSLQTGINNEIGLLSLCCLITRQGGMWQVSLGHNLGAFSLFQFEGGGKSESGLALIPGSELLLWFFCSTPPLIQILEGREGGWWEARGCQFPGVACWQVTHGREAGEMDWTTTSSLSSEWPSIIFQILEGKTVWIVIWGHHILLSV